MLDCYRPPVTSDLHHLAEKYVWWESPDRVVARRELLLCQLMQLGTWPDVRLARRLFGDQAFIDVLAKAPPGILDLKSWVYWHRFFGLEVPPLPARPLPR